MLIGLLHYRILSSPFRIGQKLFQNARSPRESPSARNSGARHSWRPFARKESVLSCANDANQAQAGKPDIPTTPLRGDYRVEKPPSALTPRLQCIVTGTTKQFPVASRGPAEWGLGQSGAP